MITLNGSVKFRNRQLPIFWTGEFAQHLAMKNVTQPATHPYKHIQAQKLLQTCTSFKKEGYIGIINKNDIEIYVVFFISSCFAVIKTCYVHAS